MIRGSRRSGPGDVPDSESGHLRKGIETLDPGSPRTEIGVPASESGHLRKGIETASTPSRPERPSACAPPGPCRHLPGEARADPLQAAVLQAARASSCLLTDAGTHADISPVEGPVSSQETGTGMSAAPVPPPTSSPENPGPQSLATCGRWLEEETVAEEKAGTPFTARYGNYRA